VGWLPVLATAVRILLESGRGKEVREMSDPTRRVAGKLALAQGLADCVDKLHPLVHKLLTDRIEEAKILDMQHVDDVEFPPDRHDRLEKIASAIAETESDINQQIIDLGKLWRLNQEC
jgi:hypothetical protein